MQSCDAIFFLQTATTPADPAGLESKYKRLQRQAKKPSDSPTDRVCGLLKVACRLALDFHRRSGSNTTESVRCRYEKISYTTEALSHTRMYPSAPCVSCPSAPIHRGRVSRVSECDAMRRGQQHCNRIRLARTTAGDDEERRPSTFFRRGPPIGGPGSPQHRLGGRGPRPCPSVDGGA